MTVQALGYLGIRTKSLEDWSDYGTKLLGLQRIDRSASSLAFRMDDRKQRIVVDQDGGDGISFFGWEVADAAALAALAAKLDAAGVKVAHGSHALADERRVKDLIVFADPLGNRVEIFHGAETTSDPFRRGVPRRRDHERSVPARPQHFGFPHRTARHGPRGDERRARR